MDERVKAKLKKYPNVIGVGYGFKKTGGNRTGTLAVIALVSKKVSPSDLAPQDRIPGVIDTYITDVQQYEIVTQEDPDRYRPAPGGCSCGHFQITAGTLGAVVRYDDKVGILSNNHVLANSNAAAPGDRILQPGKYDGGEFPVAKLTEFVPIKLKGDDGSPIPWPPSNCPIGDFFSRILNAAAKTAGSSTRLIPVRVQEGETNLVDAAFAEEWDGSGELLDPNIIDIGRVNKTPMDPTLGMRVQKRGRTTEYTIGTVTMVDVDVEVSGYGPNNSVAVFVDQVIIEADDNQSFSEGGDSGSLILNMNSHPIGLLFAGGTSSDGSKITVGNKIHHVLEAFPGMHFI